MTRIVAQYEVVYCLRFGIVTWHYFSLIWR